MLEIFKIREHRLTKFKYSRNYTVGNYTLPLKKFDANLFVRRQLRMDRGFKNFKVKWGHLRTNLRLRPENSFWTDPEIPENHRVPFH